MAPDDVDCLETEEEEYDALNDETFGTADDISNLDDWEQQHEQFAEIAESKKQSEKLGWLICNSLAYNLHVNVLFFLLHSQKTV